MRVLLLLRGSAGCGKSTWIEQNGLNNYTLSADDIRMLCSSPVLTVSGKEAINPQQRYRCVEHTFQTLGVAYAERRVHCH